MMFAAPTRLTTRRQLLQGGLLAGACLGQRALSAVSSKAPPLLTTRSGVIAGAVIADLYVFKGIPYGADMRLHRFAAATTPVRWEGIRSAMEYGPAAPQAGINEPSSEDCLYLKYPT